MSALRDGAARLYAAAWEARRRAYAAGWTAPRRVGARVVSVGNLAVGGTGKTTLTLSLAHAALAAGIDAAIVCRRYRPGPAGRGDEELLFAASVGEGRVYAGSTKWKLAQRAAADGHRLLIVDDGFSHWPLARDLDLVLLDANDPWAGGALLPAGRLREPRRALQRADWLVASHCRDAADADAVLDAVAPWAPAARRAAGRHRRAALRDLLGRDVVAAGPARVVTATGNPAAVVRSAEAAGFTPVTCASYRDHHWFDAAEAERELGRARDEGATLVLTAKDAVRWPVPEDRVAVLEVEWEWLRGGDELTPLVLAGAEER
jgi:tetraacyldisaccharide 4'-kinase